MKIFLNERIYLDGSEWFCEDSVLVLENIQCLIGALDCVNFNFDVTLYYSGDGIASFFQNLNDLDNLHDYSLTNPIDQLRTVLYDIEAKNWNDHVIQDNNVQYYYQINAGAATIQVNQTSLAEAVEYLHRGSTVGLLTLYSSEFNETNPIHVNRSSFYPLGMQIYSLSVVSAKTDLLSFIRSSRPKRNFNLSEKHGENQAEGRIWKNGEWASPLKCSRHEAQELLNLAITVKGERDLFVYDRKRDALVRFKSENNTPNNQYHGFYPEAEDRIFKIVKSFFQDLN